MENTNLYTLIETTEDARDAIEFIRNNDVILGLDTETTGLDCFTDKLVLVQVGILDRVFLFHTRVLPKDVLKELVLALSERNCILHNAKFDLKFLFHNSEVWVDKIYCTMTAESVINAGLSDIEYGLKALAKKYANAEMEKESRNAFIDLRDDQPLTEQMLLYSTMDVFVLPVIFNAQFALLEQSKSFKIFKMESELLPIVAEMEYTGIKLDPVEWSKLEAVSRAKLIELTHEFKRYAIDKVIEKLTDNKVTGLQVAKRLCIPVRTKRLTAFLEQLVDIENLKGWLYENLNVGSPYQVKAIVNLLGVDVPNTNAKTIAPFAEEHEIIKKLLDVREVEKNVDTYGLTWLENINPVTGRVHTDYFTVGTATGRFSSSNPNLQNVPRTGGFRECFIPEKDFVFISCDYSQQEYRLAGAISKEPVIISAYKNGKDMHTATAANYYEKALEAVTKEERDWGKTRNFEIIYGTTEWGLHKSLKCSLEEAQNVLKKYWEGYPTLEAFKLKAEERILELGYSITPMGRRRYNLEKPMFADSRQFQRWQSRIKREGFNHIIQGGGADIMKIAILNISKKNPFGKDKFRALLQIHDELVFEVHKDIQEEAKEFIIREMEAAEQPFLGEIPAVAEGKIKDKWSK